MTPSEGTIFPNPNYKPQEWHNEPDPVNNDLTGIPVIDAANKLSQKIIIDPKYNCFNRSYYETLEKRFDYQRTPNFEMGFVYVDLNDLKNINDTFGHEKGDQVIRMLVDFLKAKFRKMDDVIRMGGDEFIVVCYNHDNDPNFEINLQNKIKKMQKEFEEQLVAHNIPSNGFAAGVAVFDKKTDATLDQISDRADKLMYEDKKAMKGTVVASGII